jgi:hypothetical protein
MTTQNLKDMQDKFENERKQQYSVEMSHGDPQRDERNEVIKGQKTSLDGL